MANIELQRNHTKIAGSTNNYYETTAFDHNTILGTMTYFFDQANMRWELENVENITLDDPTQQRRGIARVLLTDFYHQVGRGKPVHGVITHEETLQEIVHMHSSDIPAQGEFLLPEEELAKLPIVRVLKSGSITTERVTVSRIQEAPYYNVQFYAKTE